MARKVARKPSVHRPIPEKILKGRPASIQTIEGYLSEIARNLFTPGFYKKSIFWLLVVIVLGGFFRFYNLDWDLKHSFHPDERNILGQTAGIQASAGYRVNFFAYGQFPVYLYRATGELVSTPQALVDALHGQQNTAQWVYWLFLLALFVGVCWFSSREKFKLQVFGIASVLLFLALFIKLSPTHYTRSDIFNAWFQALEGQRVYLAQHSFPVLPVVCFVLVTLVAFGASVAIAQLLETEWIGIPFYSACGAAILMGVVPGFLPEQLHLSQKFATLAFALLVLMAGLWFAWVSRIGRALVALLALWTYFASRNHGGWVYVGYGECMIIGRWWAAVFSTLTIGTIYLYVQRAYKNTSMALLAAASFAFAVVSIEQAHYCITESLITFLFVVVAICATGIIREGGWKSYLLAGAAFGVSLAAKTSSLYYLFVLLVAHLVFLAQKGPQEWELEDKKEREKKDIYSVLTGTLIVVIVVGFSVVGLKFHGILQDLFTMNPPLGENIWRFLFGSLVVAGIVFATWGIQEFKILRAQMPHWIKLAASLGLAFFLFCLLSPWSLLDTQGFMSSQNYEWHVVSISDACYVIQFKDTPRYLYHLWNLMSVELWWPLGIVVVAGMVWVLGHFLFRLFTPSERGYLLPLPFTRGKGFQFSLADLLIVCWFIPYFAFIGSWNTKFVRYMVPLIPAFCIFGARFLTDIFDRLKGFNFVKFLKGAVAAAVLGPSLFYSAAYIHIYSIPHTWIESSIWIFKNVAQGTKIMTETWDDGLPTGVDHQMDPRVEGIMGPQNYGHVDLTIYEMHGFPTDDTPIKKNYYANVLQQGDFISIASKKMWYTLTACTPEFKPHGYNVYPVTSRYYRALWSGLLGFKMVAEFHSYPTLFGWQHPDDRGEESFSVYDHPHVYFFKRFEAVPPERILKILETDDYVKGIDRERMLGITPDNVDAFIAERRKYLEEKGLWDQLQQVTAAPVTTASAGMPQAVAAPMNKPKPPTFTPLREEQAVKKPLKKERIAIAKITEVPTPEVKINPPSTVPPLPDAKTLAILKGYAEHPVEESDLNKLPPDPTESSFYQLRAWFSWVLLLVILGWIALPLTLRVMPNIPSGAYSLSKVFGFFVFAWLVWFSTSLKLCHFTLGSCWMWLLMLGGASLYLTWRDQVKLRSLYSKWGKSWKLQEGAFLAAFFGFTLVKIYIPHIHDPIGEGYNGGGEAGMDYGFLATVVRGETFPPQNMWMSGLPIGYSFYYGHLMMGILTKTLALVPAVTYNLALITLFAMVFSCAFGLAYALSGNLTSGWISGLLCALAGNPAGVRQYMDLIHQAFVTKSLAPLENHVYDFFGPTRVIPPLSINEFPYFSVLYGDMHAHTLAMPFAMLVIGVLASLYSSGPAKLLTKASDWISLVTAGFLLGGVAFLNTWEVPTWLVLSGIVVVVRQLAPLNGKSLQKGLKILFGTVLVALTLLGWWTIVHPGVNPNPHAVGGSTGQFVFFVGLGLVVAVLWQWKQPSASIIAKNLVIGGAGLLMLLGAVGLFWIPFFSGFHPQQSTVLWVIPTIRTSIRNFYDIYGLFLVVLLVSFLAAYSRELLNWATKNKGSKLSIDGLVDWAETLLGSGTPVRGMMTLGLGTLAIIWGASWVHWTEPMDKMAYSQLLATAAAGVLFVAVLFVNRLEVWLAEAAVVLLWMAVLMLHGINLVSEMSLTLNLGFFSVLWLLAFFHLGLAVKTASDRGLSFAYILVSFFFLVTAGLELFAMSEYFGFGEGMRNNSLFKYGINAWTLASIGAGVFMPKALEFVQTAFNTIKKEALASRRVLFGVAGFLIFVLIWSLLESFLPFMQITVVYITDTVLFLGLLAWGFSEGWFKDDTEKNLFIGVCSIAAFIPLLALLPQGSGRVLNMLQGWGAGVSTGFLFPAALAVGLVTAGNLLWEGQKNIGVKLASFSWMALLAVMTFMISVYPFAATARKCHYFFDNFRRQMTGSAEALTLNGLDFLKRANPADAAAIRFLNEHIPDQPCLLEFVGAGYNTWGSRFSIFTGIPALMGWDGHVGEWVGARLGDDIRNRVAATQQIFTTPDPVLAKRMLDAYGVRLVMVGTVERRGAAERSGYPVEGLAKFSGFLPLIYKNPQVEIYYNPPSAN